METRDTLYRLWTNADRWHAKFAAWVGRKPKTAATVLMIASGLGVWKLVELAAWLA